MKGSLDFEKIIYAAILYGVCSILIGYFVLDLAPYAALLAALGAGIYVGRRNKPLTAIASGFVAGLIGGLATGILSIYVKNIAGIPLSVSVTNYLKPIIATVSPTSFLFPVVALTLIGLFFGAIGGLMGSIEKLRGVFLLFTIFLLFILLGAVDNAAWNILKPGWTWEMSFSHVLTNKLDLFVAAVFAVIVTVLAYTMNLI